MTIGATLWATLKDLVIAVGRRLIGKLLRGIASRWARRRIVALGSRLARLLRSHRTAAWRLRWIKARIALWTRIELWGIAHMHVSREDLCECRKLAIKAGIPLDSPDDIEPKRAPRKAA